MSEPSEQTEPKVARGYAKGRAKRLEIIEHATVLFGEVGYHSASLREISARCGISHPGLLHHFASKEALLEAVLAHRDDVDLDRFPLDVGDWRTRLGNIVRLVEHNAQVPGIVELFAILSAEATNPEHPAHEYFLGRYAVARRALGEALASAHAAGALREGLDLQREVIVLIALMDGLQVQWLLDRDRVDMARVVEQHVAGLLLAPL